MKSVARAYEIANSVRAGTVWAVDVLEGYLTQIAAREPDIRAWELIDRDGAQAAARAIDAMPLSRRGSLAGVPFGIKDVFDTAGLRTACGFPAFDQRVPATDATVVARLRAAGAIIVGKTTTTQFANGAPTRTRNPWNAERTSGGSSSGSGAAVGAGTIPAAIGSQTGGSTLRPAAYCGAVGLKPTYGRVSRFGCFGLAWSADHVGIFAANVADTALILEAIEGPDPLDPTTAGHTSQRGLIGSTDRPRPPSIGLLTDLVDASTPTVRANMSEVVERLTEAGARPRRVTLPVPIADLLVVLRTIAQVEGANLHATILRDHAASYEPELRASIEVGLGISADTYLNAQRWRRIMREKLDELVGSFDVLLSPTASNTAPDISTTGDPDFQSIWSLVGYPAISIPSGRDSDGLPFAIQLAARTFAERRLLSAAAWCERVLITAN